MADRNAIHISLKPADRHRLDILAIRHEMSRSGLIRQLIQEAFKRDLPSQEHNGKPEIIGAEI